MRIALFADSRQQPRWLVDAMSRIARSDFAEIVLVGYDLDEGRPSPSWWWRAYQRADRWIFGIAEDPSAPVDLITALAGYPCLLLPNSWPLTAARRRHVVDAQLDVVFVLGDLDPAELDTLARHGVWRYCFGGGHRVPEAQAGLREVLYSHPVTASGLRVRLGPDGEYLRCQSSSRTFPFSVARNRSNLLGKTTLFAERELRRLHRQEQHRGEVRPLLEVHPQSQASLGPGELLWGLSGLAGRTVGRLLQKLAKVDQWFIAFCVDGPAQPSDLQGYTPLMPPKDRIWADPFPICREGRHFIFFEEMTFAGGKGCIVVTEVMPDGSHTLPRKVLERDYHLSYPFVIEWGGELYMVPESGQNRTVELYRCEAFPDRWRLEKVLLEDVNAADATLHHDGERWWMFVMIGAEGTELYDELHLYYADELLGEWRPHAANPVKSDVCGSRPAGALFRRQGAWLRPAQICTPLYGSGIILQEVRQLTPTCYEEEEVERIVPDQSSGVIGIHTLNRCGRLQVMDGFSRRLRV